MTISSTVPGALATMYGYMQAVVAANPALNAEAYYGPPVGTPTSTFIGIGAYPSGDTPVENYHLQPVTVPQWTTALETYSLACTIRAMAGDGSNDLSLQFANAFTLLNGVLSHLEADNGGSGQLSPSGSWGDVNLDIPLVGNLGSGWGLVIGFTVEVVNAQVVGS